MQNKKVRITYVEDDPDIRTVACLALEDLAGFHLDVCESGIQALETAPGSHPDLILLDVMMPGMDGIETFRGLRKFPHLDAVPIVFMTAKVQQHEVEHYKQLGAAGVIAKPFNPMTLPDEILKYLREGA